MKTMIIIQILAHVVNLIITYQYDNYFSWFIDKTRIPLKAKYYFKDNMSEFNNVVIREIKLSILYNMWMIISIRLYVYRNLHFLSKKATYEKQTAYLEIFSDTPIVALKSQIVLYKGHANQNRELKGLKMYRIQR